MAPRTAVAQTFIERQSEHERYNEAVELHLDDILREFEAQGVAYPPAEVYLRVLKEERVIELWARGADDTVFSWIRDIDICAFSGTIGPKRSRGDLQTPEGLYYVAAYNHRSRHFLSLGVSYPNRADRRQSDADDLGDSIFIHGGCTSRGCLAITNDEIGSLYVVAVAARNEGQRQIPIHIFPTRMDDAGMDWLRRVTNDTDRIAFWENLETAYRFFETHHQIPEFSIDRGGRYRVEEQPETTALIP